MVRDGDRLLGHRLVERDGDDWDRYRDDLTGALWDFAEPVEGVAMSASLVAVEGLHVPTPHMGMTSVKGLIDTARVLGWVEWVACQVWGDQGPFVSVPPGGHGTAPRSTYPPELIGAREGPKLTGRLRHCRSAWDVAGAAPSYWRLRQAR